MYCMKKDKKVSAEDNKAIYHEKQSRELCALHSLNNLFQKAKTFTKKQLDEICQNLSPDTYMNPHRSFFGLGNYDVNVIMAALQTMACDTVWFDKRRNLSDIQIDQVFGFILNVPSDLKWGYIRLPVTRKHWVAVRRVHDAYYNLDSKLDAPELIGKSNDELISYLKEQVQSKDKELILVVGQEHSKDSIWKTETNAQTVVKNNQQSTSTTDLHVVKQSTDFKESGV